MNQKKKTPSGGNRKGADKNYICKSNFINTAHRKQGYSFAEINAAALPSLPALLARWLPDGTLRGQEYIARNPRRADRHAGSFSVNIRTGRWADFATGDAGGDVISLAAYLSGKRPGAAARELSRMLGVRHD